MWVIAAILLLGVLIFVHELGHFLVAKACGVRVLRFSLGFGPPLLSRKVGHTEYWLSAFPLGGYVKMLGEDPGETLDEAERREAFSARPLWARAAVVTAGPAMNLLLPFLIFFVLTLGSETDLEPVVNIVVPDSPAEAAGLVPGDTIVAVDGAPIRYWQDVLDTIGGRPGEALTLLVERDGARRTVRVTPAVTVQRDRLGDDVQRGRIGISSFRAAPEVVIARPDAPAQRAGLQSFDRIVRVGDTDVATWDELVAAMARGVEAGGDVPLRVERKIGVHLDSLDVALAVPERVVLTADLLATRDPATAGADVLASLGLRHSSACVTHVAPGTPAARAGLTRGDCIAAVDGERVAWWWTVQDKLVVQKDKPFTLAWTRAGAPFEATIAQERFEKEDRYGQKILEFTFGARGAMSQVPGETVTYFVGPIEAARRAAARMWEMTDMMVVGVAKMIRGEVSIKALGGPIMIFDIAGKAAEEGAANYVLIMAIISINLALLNLLPVPALDGGHLMFILLEAVRRRPVSPGLREAANLVGVGLLVLLMVLVLVLDVTRYWDKLLDLLRA